MVKKKLDVASEFDHEQDDNVLAQTAEILRMFVRSEEEKTLQHGLLDLCNDAVKFFCPFLFHLRSISISDITKTVILYSLSQYVFPLFHRHWEQ